MSRAASPSGPTGRLAKQRMPDLAAERDVVAEQLVAEPRLAALGSAHEAPALFGGAGVEGLEHQGQQACGRTRLEDDGVVARLDRPRLLRLERLAGRDFGECRGVDVRHVLDVGHTGPARAGAIGRPARQDEARVGPAVIPEEPLRVGNRLRPVQLGDIAGADDTVLLADVDARAHHLRPLAGAEVHRCGKRRVDVLVILRRLHERHRLRVVRLPLRQRLYLSDRRLERLVVELVGGRRRRFLAVGDRDLDLLILLDEVGRDRRVRKARRRPLAAGELDLHGVRLAHAQNLVGDLFDLLAV